ncbi:MAG: helix-turn-helix domain-containing protein [Muribaculaceae bacterium]|nr:helix-turn-helix domain-containing protein [Muribaculaceae bacterium]
MRHLLTILLAILLLTPLHSGGATPYVEATLYDEKDGLSQQSVKQIVMGRDGMAWIATWNGLNRFDGYDFSVIRPAPGESVRRYSSRYRDIRRGASGRLWCRIDDRFVSLDPATNHFDDIHTRLEERFGRRFALKSLRQSARGDTLVMKCEDVYVAIPDHDPVEGAVVSANEPLLKYASTSNRKIGDFGSYPYQSQAYGRTDSHGHVWIVTRTGIVAYAPDLNSDPVVIRDLGVTDGSLTYSMTDDRGSHWFRSSQGAHRVTTGILPFDPLPGDNSGRVLAAARDSRGRVWVAEDTRKGIAVYPPGLDGEPMYLSSSGDLKKEFTPWGLAAYTIAVTTDGSVWIGTKPHGLFRLIPEGMERFRVESVCPGNIYDLTTDPQGRLWIATMGSGVRRIDKPSAPQVIVTALPGYPAEAMSARRVVAAGDSLILAATTGGLVAISQKDDRDIYLHVTEAGRSSSLGCIAVTDIALAPDGEFFISTESDGVNTTRGPMLGRASFSRLNRRGIASPDVALTLCQDGERLLIVGPSHIYALDDTEGSQVYGEAFWHRDMHFTEMRPFPLGEGRLLLGTREGALVADLEERHLSPLPHHAPLFTAATIRGRGDTLLTSATSLLTLGPGERTLTLQFAYPEFDHPVDILYSVRINGGEWSEAGRSRSVTLYDLKPGRYEIEVRNTDPSGRINPATGSLALEVTPMFHETLLARILLLGALFLVIGACVGIWLYIRAIKRKQAETLRAYLSLLDQTSKTPEVSDVSGGEEAHLPTVSEADDEFMHKVMDYVTSHMADQEAGVDDMASAVGVSRSGLSRKMKSLMGVSPADFMRRTRLSHAASLLATTDLPIKEIAWRCGFADLNYFGKCFKALNGATPSAFRAGK